MDQTSSILNAANCKQERIPCSEEHTILQPYAANSDTYMKSKVSNCEINFINISRIKSTFEY